MAATLAHLSGCYAEPGLVLSRNVSDRKKKRERAELAEKVGKAWSEGDTENVELKKLWDILISQGEDFVCDGSGKGNAWKQAALQLLAIADEAAAGIGYEPTKKSVDQTVSEFTWKEIRLFNFRKKKSPLELPNSLGNLVPADVCCVLPKAMTPEVGCTLRSLSHHLALLPNLGLVRAEWYIGDQPRRAAVTEKRPTGRPQNLLLVPFPFIVHASDFEEARPPEPGIDGYFKLNQGWLKDGRRRLSSSQVAGFVINLIKQAQKDVDHVHGVIFPEAALDERLAGGVARILLRRIKNLEFVICGALTSDGGVTRNEAIVFRAFRGDFISFRQPKHHRWRLDGRQILQYHLGGSLDPKANWWEKIDVHSRKMQFSVDSNEAVVGALVCEDLARHEPVLSVVSAIGPSLVVALLMDGPQLEARWSGRYATALAEDPGSSILTLTCVGMIRRSRRSGAPLSSVVGLWKDREGRAQELCLDDGNHALVLCLSNKSIEQRTLDSRSDGGNAVEYRLSSVQQVRAKVAPRWLERDA